MIDLHSHILPGIDDGPEDMAGSLTMAEVAVANGTTTIVATPHIREDYPRVEPAELVARVAELQATLSTNDIPLQVVTGGELAITRAIDLSDEELRQVTLAGNGRDLLVETPHGPMPSIFEPLVDDLQRRGFRVTLAHPELNTDLQKDPDRLAGLVDRGALVQVTAASLKAGRFTKKGGFVRKALKLGLVHVIASDAHSATWRPPDLTPALELGARADVLTKVVPAALLAGDDVSVA